MPSSNRPGKPKKRLGPYCVNSSITRTVIKSTHRIHRLIIMQTSFTHNALGCAKVRRIRSAEAEGAMRSSWSFRCSSPAACRCIGLWRPYRQSGRPIGRATSRVRAPAPVGVSPCSPYSHPRLHPRRQSTAVARTSRTSLRVVAQRAVTKKVQVVLTKQIPDLGNAGDLKAVPVGHYRNYLHPQGLAMIATESILADIEKNIAAEERAKLEEKAKAQAMATALSTIGKFIIKKKVGEEEQIFGSVSAADIVEAIRMQTGRELEKRNVTIPDIKTLGTYDCTVKLHAEVVGSFKVVVQKDTSN